MVARTWGPFPLFQELYAGVNGDTIRKDALDPAMNAHTLGALSGELDKDDKRVASQMSGDMTDAVQQNPRTVAGKSRELAGKGWFAVGLLNRFAGNVDEYDTTTSHCNAKQARLYNEAYKRWDQAPIPAGETTKPAFDYNTAYANSKAACQKEFDAGTTKLDDDADAVARDFKNPDVKSVVRSLILQGLIPIGAQVLYPGLHITSNDIATYWQQQINQGKVPDFTTMTDAQRAALLAANPYLAGELATVKNPTTGQVTSIVALLRPAGVALATAVAQANAFAKTVGRLPYQYTDWKLGAMLDPTSRQAKNGGVPAVVAVGKITPRPGLGLTRIGLYIPNATVFNVPNYDLGDNRGMDPQFDPEQTRVALYVDWETGTVVARQNPSVNTDGDVKIGTPEISVSQSSTGAISIGYKATNPFSPPDPTDSHHVEGGIVVTPDNGAVGAKNRVDGTIGDYPSFEAYHDSNDGSTTTLTQDEADITNRLGPLLQLPEHHATGDPDGPASQFTEWRNLSGNNWVWHSGSGSTPLGDPGNAPTIPTYQAYGGTLYHPDSPGVYGAPLSGQSTPVYSA